MMIESRSHRCKTAAVMREINGNDSMTCKRFRWTMTSFNDCVSFYKTTSFLVSGNDQGVLLAACHQRSPACILHWSSSCQRCESSVLEYGNTAGQEKIIWLYSYRDGFYRPSVVIFIRIACISLTTSNCIGPGNSWGNSNVKVEARSYETKSVLNFRCCKRHTARTRITHSSILSSIRLSIQLTATYPLQRVACLFDVGKVYWPRSAALHRQATVRSAYGLRNRTPCPRSATLHAHRPQYAARILDILYNATQGLSLIHLWFQSRW